jgi:outer membrane protein TolC
MCKGVVLIMHFTITGNYRPQKRVLDSCLILCLLLAAVIWAPLGIAYAGAYGQPENGSPVMSRQSLPTVLYSLQISTYVVESDALRAFEDLPGDLQPHGFVYKTDSGYYTLRFGRPASRDDLQFIEAALAGKDYSYIKVRTDPNKLSTASTEILQTEEPALEKHPRAEVVTAQNAYATKAEKGGLPPATKKPESSAGGISGPNSAKAISSTSLYEDDLTELRVFPAEGKHLNLSLEDAIKMAIDRNSDIKIASFLAPIAEEGKKSTQTVYDPSLVAGNNFYRTDRPIQSKLEIGAEETEFFLEDKWDLRAGVRQPLPTGGTFSLSVLDVDHLDSSSDLVIPNPQYTSRLTLELRQALLKEFGDPTNRSAMEIADINLSISGMEFRRTMANVMREVGTYYWRLVFYAKQVSISGKYLQDAEEIYQQLLYREQSGLADLLDVDRALASVYDRKAIFIKANTEYKLAMDQLKLLLGFAPESETTAAIIPTEKLSSDAVDLDTSALQEEALLNRPECIIANDRVSAVEIRRKLAKHMKLPTLDARAKYAFNALGEDLGDTFGDTYFSDNGSWAVGLEFVWPIGGRKAEADYLKTLYEEKQSQAELDKTSKEVIFQINSSVTEIKQLLKEIEAVENSREANRRLLSREKSRFEIRQANIQSLLDAQDDYYFAYRTYIRAISNYNISLLKLQWAKGTILQDFGIAMQ